MMFHRLMLTNFVYYILAIRLYQLFCQFNIEFFIFTDSRQQKIPNARTKYHEILLVHTKTPHNTTHKIVKWYFEFKYDFSTLQKNSDYFEHGCIPTIYAARGVDELITFVSTYKLNHIYHYNDVIMSVMTFQITSLTIIYSVVYSGADQRKHQGSASLPFVRGIHRWPVNPRITSHKRGKSFHLITSP